MTQLTNGEQKRIHDLLEELKQYGVDRQSYDVERDPVLIVHVEGAIPPDAAYDFNEMTADLKDIVANYGLHKNIHLDNEPEPNANVVLDCFISERGFSAE